MPREKDFSADEVLAKAADVFTRHGFAGTSMSMLTQELGVAKQSLYNAFGDKEALYLQSLQMAVSDTPGARALQGNAAKPMNGRERIAAFFDVVLSECSDPDHPGCMVSCGLLEAQPQSNIAQQLQATWQATTEMLRSAVEDGQRDGSIRSQLRSAELAQALMVTMAGQRVLSKAQAQLPNKKQMMATSLKHSLAILDR
jgi:TetR/AcrR family transcriptional regulator, transcriptional repressor for nem operon